MITKHYELNWVFNAPEAILTCNKLECKNEFFIVFGGHDKALYLMDKEREILDLIEFDGWCRCSYPIDLDGDGCQELLVGAGDGSAVVLKLNQEALKFFGIMSYKSKGKIICCTAGDLNANGEANLIFGGENKKLLIFSRFTSDTPQFTLYYESWVTACTIGLLQLKKTSQLTRALLVGTKNGDLQLITIDENDLKILWHKNLSVRINDIKIADVTNDGNNEIIVASDDSYLKILDSEGMRLNYLKVTPGRPLRILVHDIDGDNANEILVGGADGSFKVFHNKSLNSIKFRLKWETKVKTSIKDICISKDSENDFKNIIFGGYSREIRSLYDFNYGNKEAKQIKRRNPKLELLIDTINKSKLIYESPVPITLKAKILELLNSRYYLSLNDLKEDLYYYGYSNKEIDNAIKALVNNNSIIQREIDNDLWTINSELKVKNEKPIEKEKAKAIIEEKTTSNLEEIKKVEDKSDELIRKEEKEFITDEISNSHEEETERIKELIINYIQSKGIVSSKDEMIEKISEKGFNKSLIETEMNILKELNLLEYSFSEPRGWHLTVDEFQSQDILELKEDSLQREAEIQEAIINLLKKEKIVTSKSLLIEKIVDLGYDKNMVDSQIEKLDELQKITYSISDPRGWILP